MRFFALAAPYLLFGIIFTAAGGGEADMASLIPYAYACGTLAVSIDLSKEKPTIELREFITKAWFGLVAASALYGISIMIFGSMVGYFFSTITR